MKRIQTILCATAFSIALIACGGKQQFNVQGTLDNDVMDSAQVTNHHFAFSGKVEQSQVVSLMATSEAGRVMLDFVLEPGTITLDMIEDKVGGTPLNDKLQQFLLSSQDADLQDQLNTYLQLYYAAPSTEARATAERLYDSVEAIATRNTFDQAMQLLNENPDNALGAYAMNVVAQSDLLSYSELKDLVDAASATVKGYEPLQDKLEQMRCIDATSAGRHYTDVQGVDGKLSDIIDGHVALVDFYASWCGPCRNEIRDNLVPLYAKYKDKGLVVVGLNVWERGDAAAREAAHQKVMADLGITYPQLVDSTRTATNTYGVRGIPQILLIDADGTILARDLRGAAIEEAVVKALQK